MKLSLYILKDWFDAKGVKILASKMEDETSEPGITGIRLKDKERPELADVFFVGSDLADSAQHLGEVVVLDSIIDMEELKEKVQAVCQQKGLL